MRRRSTFRRRGSAGKRGRPSVMRRTRRTRRTRRSTGRSTGRKQIIGDRF